MTHDSRVARSLVTGTRPDSGDSVSLMNAPLAPADDPYFQQVQAFADAVRGVAPVAVTIDDARRAVAVVVAALESARTGDAVEVL